MFAVLSLLAQIHDFGSWDVVHVIMAIIIIAACVGIMYVALRQFGVQIPPFVVQIFWIVVVAVIAIIAIKFLIGMW